MIRSLCPTLPPTWCIPPQPIFPTRSGIGFRGGDALFRQRLQVYQENAGPRPTNQLPPDTELQQTITTNAPTGWFAFPVEQDVFSYYFDGDNKPTPNSDWLNGKGIVVKRTRYENGNLFELGFEDKVILDDFNDIIVEVAIIQPA